MKNNKYVHVIFISSDWSVEHRKNLYNELFKEFGEWSEIVVVQQAVGLIGHFFTRFKQKIIGLFTGKYKTRRINEHVFLFTPVILFHYGLWLKKNIFSSIDINLFKIQLEKFINKYFKDYNVVLWVYNPHFYYLSEKFKYDFLVYDYMDNLDYDPSGNFIEGAAALNKLLISKSGFIICTASYMYNKVSKLNSSSIYINNGNNYKALSSKDILNIETEISDIKKPIIGYVGGIRDWLDFELLNYLISTLNEYHFVFMGVLSRDGKKEFKKLLKYRNVQWIKYKEQEMLPFFLRKFSAGIIPFKINEFMKGVFPNKFFEYMASEIPIVTTALPELLSYSDIIGFSNNKEEFMSNCKSAAEGCFNDKIKNYSSLAQENSWEKKAKQINEILKTKITGK